MSQTNFLQKFLRSERALPWRAFVVALALRLIVVFILRAMTIGLDDMFQYDMLARSLLAGNGYRWYAQPDLYLIQQYFEIPTPELYDPRGILTSFRPPLYPAFLALVYFFTGVGAQRFFIARLVQAILNALLVPLTFWLTRKFFPDQPKAARWAAWAVAFYPLLAIYPLSLATENLFFVLLMLTLLTLATAVESRQTRFFLLSGLLIGLTALTRSVFLAFGGLAVLWVFFAIQERRKALLMFIVVSLTVLPWMARNTLLHGRLTGIESALGYDLYVGYHPESEGTFKYGISLDLMPMLDDGLRDEIGRAKAWEFIQADPGRIPYLAFRRLGFFFGLERRALTYFYSNNFFGYIPTPLLLGIAFLVMAPFVLVSSSAVFGLALGQWNKKNLLLLLLIFGYLLPHILILGEDRFHLSLVPTFSILAALCWTGGRQALRTRWSGSRTGKIALTLALLATAGLFSNWVFELIRDAGQLALLLGPTGNLTGFPY
jgi:hypothetical protein